MKYISTLLIPFALIMLMTACSEQQATDVSAQSSDTPKPTNSTTSKPNKFKVAAINKIKMANAGLSDKSAQCMVETMTAGGKIGLGEINQMNLSASGMKENASGLLSAYQAALSSCQ